MMHHFLKKNFIIVFQIRCGQNGEGKKKHSGRKRNLPRTRRMSGSYRGWMWSSLFPRSVGLRCFLPFCLSCGVWSRGACGGDDSAWASGHQQTEFCGLRTKSKRINRTFNRCESRNRNIGEPLCVDTDQPVLCP